MERARASPAAGSAAAIRVTVACSPRSGLAVEAPASVVAGATVLEAIRASGLLEQFPELDVSSLTVGIWGRPCLLDAGLNAGDRVEIYRPLAMDPKEARRLRAQGQRGTSRR